MEAASCCGSAPGQVQFSILARRGRCSEEPGGSHDPAGRTEAAQIPELELWSQQATQETQRREGPKGSSTN